MEDTETLYNRVYKEKVELILAGRTWTSRWDDQLLGKVGRILGVPVKDGGFSVPMTPLKKAKVVVPATIQKPSRKKVEPLSDDLSVSLIEGLSNSTDLPDHDSIDTTRVISPLPQAHSFDLSLNVTLTPDGKSQAFIEDPTPNFSPIVTRRSRNAIDLNLSSISQEDEWD